MFDTKTASIELPAGEAETTSVWCDDGFDDLVYLITVDEMSTGWVDDDRHQLPDLESFAPGWSLQAILESVDPTRLNGFDLVRVLQAQERAVSRGQAKSTALTHEIAYAAPGGAHSVVDRLDAPSQFAADELRPALTITRRAAESRMSLAFDLRERLPRGWELLHEGGIDLSRARVIASGTSHLEWDEARTVANLVANRAPKPTTGQLAAWICRLCVESDPERAPEAREARQGGTHTLDRADFRRHRSPASLRHRHPRRSGYRSACESSYVLSEKRW